MHVGVDDMTPSACQVKRKERESKSLLLYEKEERYRFPAEEFEIRCSSDKSAKVWRYFGDLYHNDRIVCDRVYCSPCFENQRKENLACFLGSLLPRIKHYAKSVSTGNLAIHLNDKHNIVCSGSGSSTPFTRPPKSRNRNTKYRRSSGSDNTVMDMDRNTSSAYSNFASIDSSDEFEEDQEPAVVAKTIQKHAVDILAQMSTTESLTNLIHQFRSLLRLARSNFRELIKSRHNRPEGYHQYLVSMQFIWNLIKSAIVLWRGMLDHSLSTYLEAIQFVYKTVPNDFKVDEELELLGHVLILISGSVKCCDQSTLVLFAETIE